MKHKGIYINIDEAIPGYIIWGENNKNRNGVSSHYIVFLSKAPKTDRFYGAMLTTKSRPGYNNISLQDEYFEEKDEDGDPWHVKNKNSHIVPARLEKRNDWAPFELVGRLTESGLDFVKKKVEHLTPEAFRYNLR